MKHRLPLIVLTVVLAVPGQIRGSLPETGEVPPSTLVTAEERTAVTARRILMSPGEQRLWRLLAVHLEEMDGGLPWLLDPGLRRAARMARVEGLESTPGEGGRRPWTDDVAPLVERSVARASEMLEGIGIRRLGRLDGTLPAVVAATLGLLAVVSIRGFRRTPRNGDAAGGAGPEPHSRIGGWRNRAVSLASHGIPRGEIARRTGLTREAVRLLVVTGAESRRRKGEA